MIINFDVFFSFLLIFILLLIFLQMLIRVDSSLQLLQSFIASYFILRFFLMVDVLTEPKFFTGC